MSPGAHLAGGRVEGEGIRCPFHNCNFDSQGNCIEVPCLGKSLPLQIKTLPTEEKYGMVWVWTGETPRQPVPFVPELADENCTGKVAYFLIQNYHLNVVMINAIDTHHFNTVHNLPLDIIFGTEKPNQNAIIFSHTTRGG